MSGLLAASSGLLSSGFALLPLRSGLLSSGFALLPLRSGLRPTLTTGPAGGTQWRLPDTKEPRNANVAGLFTL
ncbi:hypothetical protein GCM10027404_08680 [Arthrobacter tumbae]